jgi:signal transduction histidine kinase/ligand-binding sensor domain-containing protein
LLACATLGGVTVQAAPLPANAEFGQYSFDTFGPEVGLPQTNVTAVCQSRDGYLWVGTEAGLGRFDGVRFVAFTRSNTPALLANQSVRRLFEAADGSLWIGTESGVLRECDGAFENVGLGGIIVTAIAQDRSGHLWFGTENCGLYRYADGRFAPVTAELVPSTASIRALFVDSRDRLWVGVAHSPGVVVREGETFTRHDVGGRESRETFAIAEWPVGTLWFGCTRGLFRMRDGIVSRCDDGSELVNPQVTDLQPARGGGLWLVTGRVVRITSAEPFACVTLPRLPIATARTAIEDREGNVWVTAQFDGLVRARRTFYRMISVEDGLPGAVTKSVAQDTAGNLWVAIQNHGIARITPAGEVVVSAREQGLPSRDPLCLFVASDGTMWSGYSAGLVSVRDGRIDTHAEFRSVRVVFEDRSGTMWFGNDDALLMKRPGGTIQPVDLTRSPTMIHAITQAPDGAIYVATSPGGLFRLKEGQTKSYPQIDGVVAIGVRALYVDTDNRIWVGVKGRGLGVVDGDVWLNPDALANAVTDHVSAIVEDQHGQLWLGTPSGIMWGSKAQLLAAARGYESPRLRLAGMEDGARAMPASSHSQPIVWRSNTGTLLFATRRGVLEIDPDHVPSNPVTPTVHIEQVVIDGQSFNAHGPIELPPQVRQVAIEYTALSFVASARVGFRYRLEGYDRDWIEAGPQRTATYANLPAGRYVFHVIACNSDGEWNRVGDSLVIHQIPHFYQTWWFAALVGLAIVLAIVAAVRWSRRRLERELERMEQKQMLERERRRIARHLHDDLGANLTEIGLFAAAARDRVSEPNSDLDELTDRVRGLAGSLDAIVWTTNPANDSLDHVATYICEYFQGLFARSVIRCRVDIDGDMPAYPLTPDQRTNLFLSAKEAMNNVLKHSGATEVWLRMRMEGERFQLCIEDNGHGFDPAALEHRRRNGLQNMRSRMEELAGTFSIETTPGRRTVVVISLSFAGKIPLSAAAEAHRNGAAHLPPKS